MLNVIMLSVVASISLPHDAPLRWASGLHANMRLGWIGFPGANTLAYLMSSSVTKVKKL
jgi:hypothetical protein